MSDIKFTCPHCGNNLVVDVDAAAAGQSVPCPVCSNPIVILAEEQIPSVPAPALGESNPASKIPALILAGLAAAVVLAGSFYLWHSGFPSKNKRTSPEALSTPLNSAPAQLPVNSELEKQLVSLANLGEPQAVLDLLAQNPGLEKSLGLLADTPLRWALAQSPANARQMLSETMAKMPGILRGTQAPTGGVWLEWLESQPDELEKVRPAFKIFFSEQHPSSMDGINYHHGFWSVDRDSSYNVNLNGKAKRLSVLVGVLDSQGKNGHPIRYFIKADGRTVADSGFMICGQNPKLLVVDLTGIKNLSLRVEGGNQSWEHAVMAGALLEVTPDENIHTAAVSGRTEELAQLLDQNRQRVTEVDSLFSMTPFWAACMGGSPEAAITVALHGGELNATNGAGDTILHIAAAKGWDEAIYAACAAGSDPRLRNAAGLTAHEIAVTRNNLKILGRLTEAEMWLAPQDSVRPAPDFSVKVLNGAPVSLSSFRGRTVALFLEVGMSFDKNFNYTLIDYAQRLHDSPAGKQGRLVVLFATPDNPKTLKPLLQDHGYTFQVLSDPNETIRKNLNLYSMPVVLIDAEGCIRWQRRMIPRDTIEDSGLFLATEKVLAGNFQYGSPVTPSTKTSETNSEQILFDFEDGFQGWKTTGNCWKKSPATDALFPGLVAGYVGRSFLSTFGGKGVSGTGLAISPDFEISKPYLHLLVGGGDFPDHCAVALVCDGYTVKRAGGMNTAELLPVCWDVRDFVGKKVHLEVYDSGTAEPRDFIMLDQVVASDSATLPATYAKRFDPDNPKDSAEVADKVPASFKALQAGEFHQEAVPGITFRLERTNTVRWPDGPADWLEFIYSPPPTHFAQTMQSFSMTIEAGGSSYPGRPELTGRLFSPYDYVCYIPASKVSDRRGVLNITCVMNVNRLEILGGKATKEPQLTSDMRSILTSLNGYNYTNRSIIQCISSNELWRWSGETDAAYMLRVCRYFQRYFVYGIQWTGWPTSQPWPINAFEKHAWDCGLASRMVMLLRANGIPANDEQGCWLGDNGEQVGPHVKCLVYLQKAGWLWFGVDGGINGPCDPFPLGGRSGDNFQGDGLNDIAAQHPVPDPVGAKIVLRGNIDGGDWWHSWVVSRYPTPPADYLLDPHKAKVTDSRGSTFIWQPHCNNDEDDDHYLFGGWTTAGDQLNYTAYGMASVRGVMRMGIVSLAHPDGNTRRVEWPINAKAGQKLHFICCLTDKAVKNNQRGVKIQVELSGGGQSSELVTDELKPGDPKVIEVSKTLAGTETSLILNLDNNGKESWTVLYCDANLE